MGINYFLFKVSPDFLKIPPGQRVSPLNEEYVRPFGSQANIILFMPWAISLASWFSTPEVNLQTQPTFEIALRHGCEKTTKTMTYR